MASFRQAKARIQELADEKARAERARRRFESRSLRREIDVQNREDELTAQKRAAASAGPKEIQEMVERSRRKERPTKDQATRNRSKTDPPKERMGEGPEE
jgi:hypothetical protein